MFNQTKCNVVTRMGGQSLISFTGKKSKWWKYSARQAASLKDHGQKWKREILGDWGKESWVWRKDFWPSMKEKGYAQKKNEIGLVQQPQWVLGKKSCRDRNWKSVLTSTVATV